MKITFGKQKAPALNEAFRNGHLYQHISQPYNSVLYLCACGYLVKLPECKTFHRTYISYELDNIADRGFRPEEFEDVTDRFELREVTEN